MKKVLVLLLFGFIFNMSYATPPFHKDKDNPEQCLIVKNDIASDVIFDVKSINNDFEHLGSLTYTGSKSVSDTTIIVKNGVEFMIINYFPMKERIQNSKLDTSRCYKHNSIHFIKTLKALRKIPDTINEVYGSSGGLPLS